MEYERTTSEFNEAQLQIYRLHNIWLECRVARSIGDLVKYKWKLLDAEVELWNDAKRVDKQQKTTYVKKLNELNEEINPSKTEEDLKKIFNKLIDKEKVLRALQDAAGKGAKYTVQDERM
ncbi:MAG: hypothetical protein JSW08_00450 [archaeon]|nr:MAG: hypothetical protein JSW08_00450 [archaeon]